MILRMTVRDAATSAEHDIEVVAEPGSGVGALLSALPVPTEGRRCFVGGVPLDERATLADSPLTQGATVSVGGPGPAGRMATRGVAGVVEVVSGLDAGLTVPLTPGTHAVARSSKAAVPLRDPDVSRADHARLEVSRTGRVTVTDRGSSNGTFIDGARLAAATPLEPGSVLRIGADELRWLPTPAGTLPTVRGADGRLDFDRVFAAVPAVPRITLTLPAQQAATRNPATVAAAVVPAVGGVLLAMMTGRASMLLFSLVGIIGYLIVQGSEDNQRQQRAQAFAAAKTAVEQQAAAQVTAEKEVLHQLAPGPVEIADVAAGARPDLWARRADSPHGLTLRVGAADRDASVTLRGEPWPGFETPTLLDVPVTLDLRATGVLGVVGPDEPVRAMLRWLVLQLATLRGPDDLRIVVIANGTGEHLAWTRWLPHLDEGPDEPVPCRLGNTPRTRAARVQELHRLVLQRRAQRETAAEARFAEEVVVVLDGAAALRELPGMDEVLRDGPPVGVYLLCVDRHGINECRGLCELGTGSLRLTRAPGDRLSRAKPDGLDAATAERLARALAPMRDRLTRAATRNAIPGRVRLLDLLGMAAPSADGVLRLWGDGLGPRTRVVLGADANGSVHIDLAGQGPHTMLGGATGAGKSVLLQTLVTSLLLANRPDELNLVLVDFKGGSAFLPFEHCPHVVALLRSTGETPADVFDEAATVRVLASIRAEVSRRESVLARYEGEIDRYWQRRRTGADLPPLPRLVMIFDEFARVLDAAPDFVKELVNVAAKGRSLGMHLVLATQSLQGKLSPELRNNVSLRISLRQNEPADSVEVLGVPDAATIPGSLRGRGMILCTTDEVRAPRPFQSGYLGDPPPSGHAAPATVRTVGWADLGLPRPPGEPRTGGPDSDQDAAIAAIEEAGRRAGLPAPFRPLLPALPATLTLDELAARQTAGPPPTGVPFGLADEPWAQAQPADHLDLAGSDRLLVAGGPQSGRTTFARTLITSLAARFRPDQVHLYVIERQPGGLSGYAALPHCGGVFSPAEPDRIRRLIAWLDQEILDRSTASLAGGGEARPYLVVVIDGWEHFEDHTDPHFVDTALLTTLRGVIATGAPLGVHIVPLGGQDMLNHRLPTLYTRRLLLPFPAEETRRTHLSSRAASPPALPGRAIDAATGRHVQICEPAAAPVLPSPAPDPDPARLPRRFGPLPTRIALHELTPPATAPAASWTPLGVGGPENSTVGIDLFATGPHLLLISGPPGSGRTTAAATVAHALHRAGVGVLALAPPSSPLPGLLPQDAGIRVLTGLAVRDADLRDAAGCFGDAPYAVIVDGVDHVTVLPAEQGFTSTPTLLDDIVHPAARGRRALVVTADATPMLTGFPSPLARLVTSITTTGARIVLTPANRAVAVAHGLALEPDQYLTGPPGRGYLTSGRAPILMQVATAGTEAVG